MINSGRGFWLALFVVTGVLLYLLAPILMPFMTAAILAYIADPLVDKLEKKVSRTVAVSITFLSLSLLALILLLILTPMIERQIFIVAEKVPLYIERGQTLLLPWLKERFGIDILSMDVNIIKQSLATYWGSASRIAGNIIGSISHSGVVLAGWVANFLLMLVVTFYLLRDWDVLVNKVHALLPRKNEAKISLIAKESDEVLGAFLRGQLLVMLALSFIYIVGLKIAGLDLALLIGAVSGIVSFVPYLGFIIGIVAAGLAALMQFQDGLHLLYVVIVFSVGQMMEGMVLTPLLVGDRIGLHPVAVIFAVLAGGQLFGFLGILLALPVAAVIAVILRHLITGYTKSEMYNK